MTKHPLKSLIYILPVVAASAVTLSCGGGGGGGSDPVICCDMVNIPAGTFTMGDDTDGWNLTSPEHEVTLTRDYLLSKYEVTNREYLVALQWAYDENLVSVSSHGVISHGQVLLDLDGP